ncbi:MAG TPA: ATP-binding protein, partial [Agromyces sp.]
MALSPGIAAVRRRAAGRRDPLVLIDGPSGAGKTTFAAALADAWPGPRPRILRVDEAIPGWDGLHRGAERLGRTLTGPHARGAMGVV